MTMIFSTLGLVAFRADPLINLVFSEFPEPANLVGWHARSPNPLVDGVALHAEILSDLVD